ncbi:MAG: amidase [Ignavibacterium sp.]|jgi:Asp-tRNA(Asn)/Glu-tRNA(Gln) amidotransferase A subunit family amidase|nr:amidase [Ignavibacterium sp.]
MLQQAILIIVILFLTVPSFNISQTISKENIESAEKLIDLNFTDAERDSMLGYLEEQKGNYEKIRNIELNNSVMPSILFNPIPVGFTFPQVSAEVKFSDYSNTKIPVNRDELAFYTIGQLAELIRTKQITSTELTRFFIERLKKYDPVLHCVITLTEERAFRQAKIADEEIAAGKYRGLLHGIPFGVKDLLATKDYKTTWGAMPYKDQMIDEDATVITKLENAGAILVVKLTMGALAWGDVWFGGTTRNPWDTTKGSSGSSAGSASSVSAGLLPFAIGTETYGSIVSPSTVCGTTGLRPTFGRVSRTGTMALSWSMDKIGPICRSAEDLAIVFNAIKGIDGVDQSLYDVPFTYQPISNLKGLKIGYLKKDFDKQYDFHNNDSITLDKLKQLGAELIPIELPQFPVNDLAIMLSAEAGAAFDELTRSNKDDLLVRQIKNAWPNSFRASRFIPAVEYINASRVRTLLIQEMQKLMSTIDLFIAPTNEGDSNLLANLTGHPCVVLPNGFSDKGTPTSITFIGRLFDEGKLISFAKLYQDATDFHQKHPEMFK